CDHYWRQGYLWRDQRAWHVNGTWWPIKQPCAGHQPLSGECAARCLPGGNRHLVQRTDWHGRHQGRCRSPSVGHIKKRGAFCAPFFYGCSQSGQAAAIFTGSLVSTTPSSLPSFTSVTVSVAPSTSSMKPPQ